VSFEIEIPAAKVGEDDEKISLKTHRKQSATDEVDTTTNYDSIGILGGIE
jgi:hypothetical protein